MKTCNPQYDEHIVVDSELTITPLSYNKDLKQFSVSVAVGELGKLYSRSEKGKLDGRI